MAVKCVFAAIDERGRYSGGEAGDQTRKEVMVADYYQFGQNIVLRPKTKKIANKMVSAGKWFANSDLVGYNQKKRTTLFEEVKKVGFSKYRELENKCDTDCSAFIAVLANIAGLDIDKNIYTNNMKNAFLQTEQFDLLTDTKYLIKSDYLRKGDIVINEAEHVILICEDGSKAYEEDPVKYIVDSVNGLNLRKAPTKESDILTVLKNGETVIETEESTDEDTWARVKIGTHTGFCMKKFLKKA